MLVERGLQALWASGSCGEELGVEPGGQTGGGKAEVWPWGCLPQHPIEKGGGGGGFSTTASSGPGPFPGGPSLTGRPSSTVEPGRLLGKASQAGLSIGGRSLSESA